MSWPLRQLIDRGTLGRGLPRDPPAAGYHCVRMEEFGARPGTAEEVCRAAVAEADLFVGLIGHLHGSRPKGSELSYTEMEVAAAKAGKPLLLYLAARGFETSLTQG